MSAVFVNVTIVGPNDEATDYRNRYDQLALSVTAAGVAIVGDMRSDSIPHEHWDEMVKAVTKARAILAYSNEVEVAS